MRLKLGITPIIFVGVATCSVIVFIFKMATIYNKEKDYQQVLSEVVQPGRNADISKPQDIGQGCGVPIKTCSINSTPKKSIFYIKIQKTSSTSIRSTLLLYGRKYNLTICMDATDLWSLNWPYRIDNVKLTKLHEEKCGLVADELVYEKSMVKQLMNDDVFIMASVRHPVQHFLSLYKYTRVHHVIEKLHARKLDQHTGMRFMLQNPELVQNAYATLQEREMRDKGQVNLLRRNVQLFSLGIREYDVTKIFDVTKEIDFFVVTEHYDESMIALRDHLCCSIDDVLYRKQNVRRTSKERRQDIPSDIQNAILEFNKGDLFLYLIALQRLKCDLRDQKYVEQSLGIFRYELQKYEEKCKKEPDNYNNCPPVTNGQVGVFVETFRNEQREKVFRKLKDKLKLPS